MATTRKTRDELDIEGNYGEGWEVVTCEETWRDARRALLEYRENEPGVSFRIRNRRVPLTSGE